MITYKMNPRAHSEYTVVINTRIVTYEKQSVKIFQYANILYLNTFRAVLLTRYVKVAYFTVFLHVSLFLVLAHENANFKSLSIIRCFQP
jgi:hypothetical protein